MPETQEPQNAEEEAVRKEAKRLAESQGLKWKDLPKERRREFKKQARAPGHQAGTGAGRPM
jgi:hypothetical protein